MSEIREILERARSLVEDCHYGEAEALLHQSVEHYPDNPDLLAELGLIYCYGQKEFKAAELLPNTVGANRHEGLAEVLRDYFFCREQLARKFNVPDEKAGALRKVVSQYANGTPEGIGIKLSACLIVKNEEKHLDRCLSSLHEVVDEIVVVDTGSTDRTIEIAKKHGAVIGYFEWCDDFAAARNESLRLASGNWALWIDADEELDPTGFDQIREALIRPQFAGYYFQIVNFMDEKAEANTYVHSAVRLFRLIPGVEFTGRIHEQIINGFKERGYVPATLSKGVIRHYGYQAGTMAEKNKIERTVSMLEREVADAPDDPFHWFNLSNVFSVASRHEDAEQAGRKCVELIQSDAPYGPAAFQILCAALIALHRPADALKATHLAEEKGFHSIINEFERAHALFELRRHEEALEAIDRCVAMDWPVDLTGDYGIKTYKGQVLRSQILCALDRFEESEAAADLALSKHPDFPMGLFAKAALYERMERWEEAFDYFVRCATAPGLEVCRKFAAKMASKAGKHYDAALLYREYWLQNNMDSDAWLGWLQCCEAVGDTAGTLSAYEAVGEENIPGADLLINWGRTLEAVGRMEEALNKYAEAISRNPENANAYFNCGDLLYKMGHYEQAAHVYDLGLRRNPEFAQGWFVLGNCYARMNMISRAKASYDHALVLQPEHNEAKHNREVIAQAA